MRSLVTMKINNLIVKIFLGIYLVIIIAGVVVFENIGFAGGGLEKNAHTVSNSETQPVIANNISSETAASEAASRSSESETIQTESESIQTEAESPVQTQAPKPSYTFANGHITSASALKNYRVTGASYVNMHKDKNGGHSFASVPGGTTGSILSVGAYYTLIDYNGTSGYVYNSYLEVY